MHIDNEKYNEVFSTGFNVADIMREIKNKVNKNSKFNANLSMLKDGIESFDEYYEKIYSELNRINEFIKSTYALACQYEEPGRFIPVSNTRPQIVEKTIFILKRIIRKATRYLMLDQKKHNSQVDACIKAIFEYHENMSELMNCFEQNCQYQRELIVNIEKQLCELNKNIANKS